MNKLEVLELLQDLILSCSYAVPDTGCQSYSPDYVVDHEALCDKIACAIQEEKDNEH